MNIALSIIAASVVLSAQEPSVAGNVVERTYKVGDEATYSLAISDASGSMHVGAKVHVKTLALLDGGKASQELSATDVSGGPDGAAGPDKVTWTFAKDGTAAADFNTNSGLMIYSILAMVSYVLGEFKPGKEFKVAWTSPDKMSTITGTGTCDGFTDLKGVKVAVVKTTLQVTPAGQSAATVHNSSTVVAATGKLISSDGTVDLESGQMTLKVSSG